MGRTMGRMMGGGVGGTMGGSVGCGTDEARCTQLTSHEAVREPKRRTGPHTLSVGPAATTLHGGRRSDNCGVNVGRPDFAGFLIESILERTMCQLQVTLNGINTA